MARSHRVPLREIMAGIECEFGIHFHTLYAMDTRFIPLFPLASFIFQCLCECVCVFTVHDLMQRILTD